MRERLTIAQAEILCEGEEAPERRGAGAVEQIRQQKIQRQRDIVVRQRAQQAPGEEDLQRKILLVGDRRENLVSDQITAQYKKQIDTGPAGAAHESECGPAADEAAVMGHQHQHDCGGAQGVEAFVAGRLIFLWHGMMTELQWLSGVWRLARSSVPSRRRSSASRLVRARSSLTISSRTMQDRWMRWKCSGSSRSAKVLKRSRTI